MADRPCEVCAATIQVQDKDIIGHRESDVSAYSLSNPFHYDMANRPCEGCVAMIQEKERDVIGRKENNGPDAS
jgi:hypothetical protein